MKSASALKIVIGIFAAIKVLFLLSCCMQLILVARAPFSMAEAQTNDLRQRLCALLSLAWFVLFLVVYLIWLFQAKRRSIELGASNVEYTPGLAVGCHFIPIANLFMPYKAMAELWKASLNPADWQSQRVTPGVAAWWTPWIFGTLVGWLVVAEKGGHGIDHLRRVTIELIVSALFTILSIGAL